MPSESESSIRKRYNDLKRKGVVILDIAPDTVPRLFLDVLIKRSGTSFNYFFDEFVIEHNKKALIEQMLGDICKNDDKQYRNMYIAVLLGVKDRRTRNAVVNEFELMEDCYRRKAMRMPFMGISTRRRVVRSNANSPIRVFLHVADKMDLRMGAALYCIPLWQYIGELISEGMLRMFVRTTTTPRERALLDGKTDENIAEDIVEDGTDVLYERIIHEYRSVERSTYGMKDPKMRRDFDLMALRMIRRSNVSVAYLWDEYDKGGSEQKIVMDMIDISKTNTKKISIIAEDDGFTGDLSASDISDIVKENNERMMGNGIGPGETVGDPLTRGVLDNFKDIIFKRDATKSTKIRDVWKQLRAVVRSQVETLTIINDVDIDISMDAVTNEVCQSIFSVMVKHSVLDPDSDELLILDTELLKRMRYVIDDKTMDGGITKSNLRRKIGRNHTMYLDKIDELLAYLLETGKYAFVNGRYIAVTGGVQTTRMVQSMKRGRPRKDAGREIVREVDGKLTDYLPIPKKNGKGET